jgi:hypothetical protein
MRNTLASTQPVSVKYNLTKRFNIERLSLVQQYKYIEGIMSSCTTVLHSYLNFTIHIPTLQFNKMHTVCHNSYIQERGSEVSTSVVKWSEVQLDEVE